MDGVDRLRPQLAPAKAAGSALAGLAAALLVSIGGCRAAETTDDAPPTPLSRTFESPERLAEAVLAALAADDGRALAALPLSETEFRTVVWPDLPSSRPERGLPFEYVWGDLHQKSGNALRRLVARAGGDAYDFVAIGFDGESTPYETFTVHRDSRVTVRGADGAVREMRLFGSVLQRGDEYKLFSYVVD